MYFKIFTSGLFQDGALLCNFHEHAERHVARQHRIATPVIPDIFDHLPKTVRL